MHQLSIKMLDQGVFDGVDFLHMFDQIGVFVAVVVDDAFVGVDVGTGCVGIGGVVVLVFEPVETDTAFALEKLEGEVFVE